MPEQSRRRGADSADGEKPASTAKGPAKSEEKSDGPDRIGQPVADPRWTTVSYEDGQYRVEDGVIVEKIS